MSHAKHPLRILFISRSATYIHSYASIMEALIRRGHTVRLLFDRRWSADDSFEPIELFRQQFPQFSYGWAVSRCDRWRNMLFYAREVRTYRRYLSVKEQVQSSYYKDRWKSYLPKKLQRIFARPVGKMMLMSKLCGLALAAFEKIVPSDAGIRADILGFNPDVVVPAPTNMRFSSADLEYLKAAKSLGIPTVLPVLSWDNLTTKGLIHVRPDLLLAWNEVQREEARVHHGIPSRRVKIIGAPVFDNWFRHLTPSTTRADFCAAHGLPQNVPYIVYLGSSSNMAEDETWLIRKLRGALDQAEDPAMREVSLVVRPHPGNFKIYANLALPKTWLIPREGVLPNMPEAVSCFYDTLHHAAAAVVGVNTSSVIETVIADKPVVTLLTDEYRKTQIETQHFQQLVETDALAQASTPEEGVLLLKQLIAGHDRWREKRAAFIKKYIRPFGRDRVAGEAAADEIEMLVQPV